jgi:beta-glucosidase
MCSYNQVNNSYACGNSYVLNHLLKNELDFQGFVMSDWAAQHSGVSSALAGLDMTMPGDTSFDSTFTFWGTNLTLAVVNGTVPEWRIDDMATRIMAAYFKVGRDQNQVPPNFSAWTEDTVGFQHAFAQTNLRVVNEHVDVRGDHAALIREIGSASTVLLKNTGALPLSGKEKLTALFGEDAGDDAYGVNGCSNRGCNNGTLAMGWGSGVAEFPYLVSPATAIQNEVLSNGGTFSAITDNWAYDSSQEQIQNLAKRSSVSIVFVNADSGEGFIIIDGNAGDRKNLTVWNGGDHLIQNVSAVCNNTIVVMHTVGVVMVNEWYSNPNITAIIWAGLPGQESGNSLTDILYGKVNPGGKLPFSIAAAPEDYGVSILDEPNGATIFDAPQQDFTEGVFIDYRALDKAGKTPIYEFGFGLSYTTFTYSNLQVVPAGAGPYIPTTGQTTAAPVLGNFSTDLTQYLFPEEIERVYGYIYPYINFTDAVKSNNDPGRYGQTAAQFTPPHSTDSSPQPLLASGGAPGGNPSLYDVLYHVSATITNTGQVAGDEVAQLYVSLGGANDPKVVLRGFDRITIAPGASATFQVDLTRRDVSNWDVVSQNWVVTSSPKTVWVGASSKNLPLSAPLPA